MHVPPSKLPPEAGGIEFELTDLTEAKEALDRGSIEIAAEAARPAALEDWTRRRRPRSPTDRALSGATIEWMLRLPAQVRPTHLCERMPRLANRIAEAWLDPVRCLAVLDDLLSDRRGGRRGYATDLEVELRALRDDRARLADHKP